MQTGIGLRVLRATIPVYLCAPQLKACAALLLIFMGHSWGQEALQRDSPKLEFEAASIKPASDSGAISVIGGPGTGDPTSIVYNRVTLRILLMNAYSVKNFQITGPAFLDDLRFDIKVKVAEGVTKDETRLMLQNLLKDRYGLAMHWEQKEMPGHVLMIGKHGSTLRQSAVPVRTLPDPHSAQPGEPKGASAANGPRPDLKITMTNGKVHLAVVGGTVGDICELLSNQFGHPVVDRSGLTGKYDFELDFSPEPMIPPPGVSQAGISNRDAPTGVEDPAPSLMSAVQDQLGLRLEASKLTFDVVVVDHIERTATDN